MRMIYEGQRLKYSIFLCENYVQFTNKLVNDAYIWCYDNFSVGTWNFYVSINNKIFFTFDKKEDAMLFKLVWI